MAQGIAQKQNKRQDWKTYKAKRQDELRHKGRERTCWKRFRGLLWDIETELPMP